MALSDAKTNDAQAGFETGIGAVLAALAGINVISGPGMLDYESTISLEKMVIDDEICALAYRLISGIVPREDLLAEHLFEGFGLETDFLKSAHTRKWYRVEHLLPIVVDRDPYDAWEAKEAGRSPTGRPTGSRTCWQRIPRRSPIRRWPANCFRLWKPTPGLTGFPSFPTCRLFKER